MSYVELPGIDGTNPLGFLAALGVLAVQERMQPQSDVRLSWTDTVIPVPRLHGVRSLEDLVADVLADRDRWRPSVALDWPTSEEPWTDVKVQPDEVRAWLRAAEDARPDDDGRALSLVTALVAETSVDRSGAAKPSDLHFTAGRQQFLVMARKLRDVIDADRLVEALDGPWRYDADAPSFMWDVTDDRVYALAATNPATDQKLTVPGAEWLALMGLALLPVVGAVGRTLTPGCAGSWQRGGSFSWPIWQSALTVRVVRSLVTTRELSRPDPPPELALWGVRRVCRSRITRSAQGGYGTFRPTDIVYDSL